MSELSETITEKVQGTEDADKPKKRTYTKIRRTPAVQAEAAKETADAADKPARSTRRRKTADAGPEADLRLETAADADAAAAEMTDGSADRSYAEGEAAPDEAAADAAAESEDGENKEEKPEVEGILEIAEDGFGFLRFDNFLTSSKDIYVSNSQIRRFGLRTGDKILGITRKPRANERFGALLYVKAVNGMDPMLAKKRPHFDNLTPIFPDEKIILENSSIDLSTRVMDLVAPIGRGQRGLIVAQPKAGKTVLLKKIAASVEEKYPDIELIVLLVDERPEEVTDMKRSLHHSEVIYSTQGLQEHTTWRYLHQEGRCQEDLIRARSIRLRSSSERPGTSRRAAASPSSRQRSSRPEAAWMMSSMRNSKGPAIWSCTSTGSSPSAGYSRLSICTSQAREERICCSHRRSTRSCSC